MTVSEIHTIGHSTHTADQFLLLLQAHEIRQIADIRTVPKSRRHPHFERDALAAFLTAHGFRYRHFPGLGGLRKPRADSVNTGWRHEAFRGYADHMQTVEFHHSVEDLLAYAECGPTAVMCAEAVWWRCHRQLLADSLVARGVRVWHILSARQPNVHQLSDFAKLVDGRVTYPGLL